MSTNHSFARWASAALALFTAVLVFAVPQSCLTALQQAARLCAGPLLVSLFPFLIVSALLTRSGALTELGWLFAPLAWLLGCRAPAAGGILLLSAVGGFAPAAGAVGQSVRAGQLAPEQAARLLPACTCAGPSFVVVTVGSTLLGSAGLGWRLFFAQLLAGWLCGALCLRRGSSAAPGKATGPEPSCPAPSLAQLIGDAAGQYLRLCGLLLYFRLLSGGLAALLPQPLAIWPSLLLEVCSGCAAAAALGPGRIFWCCAVLSLQSLSVLMQVQALCGPSVSLRPLLLSRLVHLPLSLLLLWLFLLLGPQDAADAFSTLPARVIPALRVPADCALLVFAACCLLAWEWDRHGAALFR